MKYLEIFWNSLLYYPAYLWGEIRNPHWANFFYWLIGVSLIFCLAELIRPWRRQQSKLREDFWLDGFYMFFNSFLVPMAGLFALSQAFDQGVRDLLAFFGARNPVALELSSWPRWVQLPVLFMARDFIQWNIHRLLHRLPLFWEWHKVHHSVREMGFSAHLRYHWLENFVYRALEYLPLSLLGFAVHDFFLVYIFSLAQGHFNHSNLRIPLGPFKYIFNNPQLHIWHHSRELPPDRPYGANFALSLSLWDYLFGTAYLPGDGRDIRLGFKGDEKFPRKFGGQLSYGLWPRAANRSGGGGGFRGSTGAA